MQLYDYQKDAVADMLMGKVLNASQIGTGKTFMALGCVQHLQARSVLVIVPKSLVMQWAGEVSLFLPAAHVQPILGSSKARKDAYKSFKEAVEPRILITTYDLARIDIATLLALVPVWDVEIFDEVHKLKEPRGATRKAVKQIRATHRFGLSGSPVVNHLGNLYNILNILKPLEFPNYWQFLHRHAILNQWRGVLAFKNEAALRLWFAQHMVRKTFADASVEMPPLTEIEIPFELSEKEWTIYDTMRKVLIFDFTEGDISKLNSAMQLQNSLTRLGKLQEVADSLELVGEHKESSKLEILRELLQDQVADDEKVIVFTRFKRMANILHRELPGSVLLTGDTADRLGAVNEFKFHPDKKILVATNAAREGLNLQEANVVVHYDQDFTASSMEQRQGRAWRSGQTRPVRVYHLLGLKTVDYKFQKLVSKKKTRADLVFDEVMGLLKD